MKFYRYEDFRSEGGPHFDLFELEKETKCGWWIKEITGPFLSSMLPKPRKWISKTSNKKYAYPSKKEALEGYIARKKRQIAILKDRLDHAQECLAVASKIKVAQDRIGSILPKPRSFDETQELARQILTENHQTINCRCYLCSSHECTE